MQFFRLDAIGGLALKVHLCREDEIALREAINLVGPDFHPHLPPGQLEVGVVSLLLGEGAYFIY